MRSQSTHRKTCPFLMLVSSLIVAGCAARESEMARYGVAKPASPLSIANPIAPAQFHRQLRLGESVQRRPIDMLIFGEASGVPVLILGAINGDETTSADLTRHLIELLESEPNLISGKNVAIIPVANPDGYAAKTRLNANRVDVNRNFPASNYRAGSAAATRPRYGASAASEPEAKAILKAI